ncbi:tetratricopeptide repeat protein [Algoriphagus namhaensis]
MKNYLVLFFSGLICITASGQSTLYQTSTQRELDQSLLLFDKELFSASLYDHTAVLSGDLDYDQTYTAELHRAISALELESPDGAGLMKSYIIDNPNHPSVATAGLYLGDHFFYKRDYRQAIEGYELVNPNSLDPATQADLYFKHGYAYFLLEDYTRAAPLFDHAKGLGQPISADAYYYSGFIAMQNGNNAKAISDLEAASKSPQYQGKTPYLLSALYFQQGSYDQLIGFAEPKLSSGASLDRAEMIHLYLAEAYFEKQNFAKAAENYDAFINARKGELSREQVYKGGVAQFEIGNYPRATDYLKVSANGDDAVAQASSYYLAQAYLKQENYQFAATSFNAASKLDFNQKMKEESLVNYAKVNLQNGSFQLGITALDDYLENYPNGTYRTQAEGLLSEALINTSDYLRALEQMERINNKSPRIREAYQKVAFYQAMIYYRDQKYNPSLAYLEKSLTYPIDRELVLATRFWQGEVQAAKGDLPAAIKSYETLRDLRPATNHPYLIKTHYGLGYAYFNSQQYPRAEEQFRLYTEKLRGRDDKQYYDDALLRLGDCYYVQKRFAQAESIFQRAIDESNSGIDYAYYRLAVVQNFQSKNADALYQLDRLISSYPNSLYFEDALYQKGQINMEQTNYQQAVDEFTRLIREKPSSPFVPFALEGRAVANFSLQQYGQTAADYQRILKDYPNSENAETALKGLQETLAMQGRSGEFGDYLENYKSSNPASGSLQALEFEAAKALYFDKNYPKAISALENYLRSYPESAQKIDAIYFLGDSYFQTGQVDQALSQFKRLETEQASPRRLRAMQRIGEIELARENYAAAIPYLEMAAQNSRNKIEEAEAVKALVQSYYATQAYGKAISSADQLLTLDGIIPETTPTALLVKAKSQKALNRGGEAENTLMQLVNEYKTIQGAEGLYLLALSFQEAGNFIQSNETIFDFSGPFVDFDYWYGRMFLLLADNYQKMGEDFQAKATLESIVEKSINEEIKAMAQAKLNNLK